MAVVKKYQFKVEAKSNLRSIHKTKQLTFCSFHCIPFLTYPEITPGGDPAWTSILTCLVTEPCLFVALHWQVPESATTASEIKYSTPVSLESRSYTLFIVSRSVEGSEPATKMELVCTTTRIIDSQCTICVTLKTLRQTKCLRFIFYYYLMSNEQ